MRSPLKKLKRILRGKTNLSNKENSYEELIAAESKKWGDHLQVEATGEWHSWLDHPQIKKHYHELSLLEGRPWQEWVKHALGHPAARSLDLGCGAGDRSLTVFQAGSSSFIEGIDVSEDRIAEAERRRQAIGAPGKFIVGDINTISLPANQYDLIFSGHSFHHFLKLEHVMQQVHDALTPNGLFILEEFVGPTQFQWTDEQMQVVKSLMALAPERFRMLRWGARKDLESRPAPADVVAVSPFESIRSAEIFPLFKEYFQVDHAKSLGGTLQHLFYNGIAHNFREDDEAANRYVQALIEIEDSLINSQFLPADFMLLVGRRRDYQAG